MLKHFLRYLTIKVVYMNNVQKNAVDFCHPDDGGVTFLRNVGSYNNHTGSHPRRRHSSGSSPQNPHILHSINLLTSVAEK
jgi:hypothetical protein